VENVVFYEWSPESGPVEISLYNYGKIKVKIDSVYVNGQLVDSVPVEIPVGEHGKLLCHFAWVPNTSYRFKIITERGSSYEGEFVSPR
jgi:hypothetical protein